MGIIPDPPKRTDRDIGRQNGIQVVTKIDRREYRLHRIEMSYVKRGMYSRIRTTAPTTSVGVRRIVESPCCKASWTEGECGWICQPL